MSWNLCVTTIIVGFIIKTLLLCQKHTTLNNLRGKLHQDAELRQQSGETVINNLALRELKILQVCFYMTMILFIPTWIFSRYFVHHDLPIPIEVPPFIDLSDNTIYILAFIVFAVAGVIGLTAVAETQLAMFGILIQISREYSALLNDVIKLDEIYADPDAYMSQGKKVKREVKHEVNPWLKKAKTRQMLKKFSNRLQELIEYTEAFEFCYNASFLMEIFAGSVIIITLGYQTLLGSLDISGDLISQTGYLSIVVVDLFVTCLYATRLQTQCFEVGVTAYSTKWYIMSTDIQKDISLFILRSQNPPKITAAKLMQLDLTVFMQRMGNIFSALAVLRQFEFKAQKDFLLK